jgi:hypothetical protein
VHKIVEHKSKKSVSIPESVQRVDDDVSESETVADHVAVGTSHLLQGSEELGQGHAEEFRELGRLALLADLSLGLEIRRLDVHDVLAHGVNLCDFDRRLAGKPTVLGNVAEDRLGLEKLLSLNHEARKEVVGLICAQNLRLVPLRAAHFAINEQDRDSFVLFACTHTMSAKLIMS